LEILLPTLPPDQRRKFCRHGTFIYPVNDDFCGRSLDLYGDFLEGEIELLQQLTFPGMIAVEAGAYCGYQTVFLGGAIVPDGRVLAFEKNREFFDIMLGNLALNNIANVETRRAMVGAASGTVPLPDPVPAITIDSLNLAQCDLIKVSEDALSAVEGARATLARCEPLLYLRNDVPEKSAALTGALDRLEYAMYWHRPRLFQANNFACNAENVFGDRCLSNLFCLPKTNVNFDLTALERVVV
jgi:hypothetical protein